MQFQDVQGEYERNNRSNGMKALRCFPRCRETGHCKSGFCGTSLKCSLEVRINRNSPPCQLDDTFWKDVTYIAEMRESSIPGLSSVRFVSRHEIESQIRTRPEKFKSLIEGQAKDVKSVNCTSNSATKVIDLEFNSQCQAWHYGWQSHKYKKDTKHCIDVLVLVENGNDGYFVAASFMSPEFEIVSTKTVQKKVGLLADDGMSQAIRMAQKDIGPQSTSSVLANLAKEKRETRSTDRQQRETKRLKLQRERELAVRQQEQQQEGEDEEDEDEMSSSPEGEGGMAHQVARMLPEMFASLQQEDIVEL